MELVPLDNGCFLARFSSEELYACAKYEGPSLQEEERLIAAVIDPGYRLHIMQL